MRRYGVLMRAHWVVLVTMLVAGAAAGCSPDEGAGAGGPVTEPAPVADTVEDNDPAGPAGDELPVAIVSDACDDAFTAMAGGYDELYARADYTDDEANALEIPPLTECTTAAEWFSAAKANPRSLGLIGPEFVTLLDLEIRCNTSFPAGRSTPVCRDAIITGLVE